MNAGILSGSRFFGDAHPRSDADFCFEDTPEMAHFLSLCGWHRKYVYDGAQQERSYWKHQTHGVDVILVRSIERRRILRNVIRRFGLFRLIVNKKNRQKVWWILGICFERLHAIYRNEKLDVKPQRGSVWEEPFRD